MSDVRDGAGGVLPDLPEGWAWATLDEVAEKSDAKQDPQSCPEETYLGMGDVEAQTMRLLTRGYCAEYKSQGNAFEAGQILYGRLRPYLNKVFEPSFSGVCSAEFIVIKPAGSIRGDFLARILNSASFVQFAATLDTGARPRVKYEQISAFQLALPPREQQEMIVRAISEEFGRLDAIEAEIGRANRLMEQFRSALLRDAFSGHLVSPHAAPEADQVDSNGRPELPQGWEWRTLGDLCDPPEYGWTTRASQEGEVKLLRTTDITNGPISWPEIPCCEVAPDDLQRYGLRAGDLVISRTGAGAGSSALISSEPPDPAVFASYLIRFRPQQNVSSNFLAHFLDSHGFWAQVAAAASGLKKNINATKLRAIQVAVPPLDEQLLIVEALECELARLKLVQAVAASARDDIKYARESILHRALIGQLVTTDRAEGNAA